MLASAIDTWATVAVAIGTLGAVAYALFRDVVVTPRRRPQLELRFEHPGTDQVVVETEDGLNACCVRLRVVNRPGKDTADDVVAVVTEIRQLADDETIPIGLPLRWSGSNPPLTVASVHPGSERHIDLVHVGLPGREGEAMPLQLDVSPKPAGSRHIMGTGSFEISLEVRARNADATRYTISVTWDGKWSGKAAMHDHLRVEQPRKAR
jgi:hypothetical protein